MATMDFAEMQARAQGVRAQYADLEAARYGRAWTRVGDDGRPASQRRAGPELCSKVFNLDTKYWNKDHLTKVLTSDLNDPASYVNTLNVANKSTLQAMSANFNFNASGTLDTGVTAQDATQTLALVEAYTFYVPSRTVPAEAKLNKDYYESQDRFDHQCRRARQRAPHAGLC